ncbi:hypothetical protein IMCC3317_12900 [Kordia antarctica]|uniref:Uncharacterized protein n=1 Tax=Kordia antarctica TaxID=1218801 RepID=A0A7L4ZH17_9FLAO|nr:hypothetical protein [Kordia antarctica]QHI35942.1 hypothetical protein IMCC3317_12900 [Kordia antarctica]
MTTKNTSKSASTNSSKAINEKDLITNFLTNLEELHKEASKIQANLQQDANEKIQAANETYKKVYESEQKSLSDYMQKSQKSTSDSGNDEYEAYCKANKSFFKKLNDAQENFRNTHTKINEDFSEKFQSKHKGLLKDYIKVYREYNTSMMDVLSKSVQSNNPNEVIKACQSMISVSQDALVKGIHLEQ